MYNGACVQCKTDETKPEGCYKENVGDNGCGGTYKYYTAMSTSCWAAYLWDASQCKCVSCTILYPQSEGWYSSKPSGCWTAWEQVNCNGPVWTHYTNQADSCNGSFNSNTCTCTQCPSPYSMSITQVSQCNYLYNPSLSCIWGNQCCKCVGSTYPSAPTCDQFTECYTYNQECKDSSNSLHHSDWACGTHQTLWWDWWSVQCYCYYPPSYYS